VSCKIKSGFWQNCNKFCCGKHTSEKATIL